MKISAMNCPNIRLLRIVDCHNKCCISNKNVGMTSLDRVLVKTNDDDDDHIDNDYEKKTSPLVAK